MRVAGNLDLFGETLMSFRKFVRLLLISAVSWMTGTVDAAPNGNANSAASGDAGNKGNGAESSGAGDAQGKNAATGCAPSTSPKGDLILCEGVDFKGVAAGKGDDTISVFDAALVATVATDPNPQTIAIDGGEGNDLIRNAGVVLAEAVSVGNGLKANPALGANKNSGSQSDIDNKKAARAVGIEGGVGDDIIENTGAVQALATSIVNGQIAKGTPKASDAAARATGISGGDGSDTIINQGEVAATSISTIFKIGEYPLSDISSSNDSSTLTSFATGIDAGAGDDTVVNGGSVVSVAVSEILNGSEGNSESVRSSAESGNLAQALATGVDLGDGNDSLNNTGSVTATAMATSQSITIAMPANGNAAADSTSNTDSSATAVDTGDGDDLIENSGQLTASATSVSNAIGSSVSDSGNAPKTKSTWKGGASSTASAMGINTGDGDDGATNSGEINAIATAVSGASAVAIAAADVATENSEANASATAVGAELGGGDDNLNNSGAVNAVSTATAGAASFALSQNGETKAAHEGGAVAEATATGLAADGADVDDNLTTDKKILPHSITLSLSAEKAASTGVDQVSNSGAINAVATAVSGADGSAIAISGAATSDAKSSANAQATGVDLGAGDDQLNNSGAINAVATATSGALGVGFSQEGASSASANAEATAKSVGISADGNLGESQLNAEITIGSEGLDTSVSRQRNAGSGEDNIVNSGAVNAVATALSQTQGTGVSVKGAASANAESKATATSIALDAGIAADTVSNSGNLSSVATSVAHATAVSFAQNGDASANINTAAESIAAGISADGDVGTQLESAALSIGADGLKAGFIIERNAASGDDVVTNNGTISAVATATSLSDGAVAAIDGGGSVTAKSSATASATGVDLGAGNDALINSSPDVIASEAPATSALESQQPSEIDSYPLPESVDFELPESSELPKAEGLTVALPDSEQQPTPESQNYSPKSATEEAIGDSLNLDDGEHGELKSALGQLADLPNALVKTDSYRAPSDQQPAIDEAAAEQLPNSADGDVGEPLSFDLSGAISAVPPQPDDYLLAEPVDPVDPDTTADQAGSITAVAVATANAVGVSVSPGKQQGGQQEGDQQDQNSGQSGNQTPDIEAEKPSSFSVDVSAEASAAAIGVSGDGSFGSKRVEGNLAISTQGFGSSLQFESVAGTGDDLIENSGAITAVAVATSTANGDAVAIEGAAAAEANSKARAVAMGVDAGDGDDSVDNSGAITAVASATALSTGASFSDKEEASAKANAEAEAIATGINGDADTHELSGFAELSIDGDGLNAAAGLSRTVAAGDDQIVNSNAVTAVAAAQSGSGTVAVTQKGSAVTEAKSSATSLAVGIDAGSGADSIDNSGAVTAVAAATAAGVAVSVSTEGDATALRPVWDGAVEANAKAVGIAGDSVANDFESSASLDIDFTEKAIEASSHTFFGQAGDNDTISNSGAVTATAVATAPSAAVSVAKDTAAAVSSARASAEATGIDAGTGDDSIENSGAIVATAVASAAVVNVAVSKSEAIAVDGFWDGGTHADAAAYGLRGDGEGRDLNIDGIIAVDREGANISGRIASTAVSGDDDLSNEGAIVASAVAVVPEVNVAVGVEDVAAAISSASADALAVGIDAGSGKDQVDNSGAIVATAVAAATSVNVAVSKDAAVAGNMVSDGGTTARAEAIGISGDGVGTDYSAEGAIEVDADHVGLYSHLGITTVAGDDTINNSGAIVTTAVAEVPAVSVAVTSKGVSAAVTTAQAEAVASGIDAGAGDDTIANSGSITTQAIANANVVNVAVTSSGGAIAADAVWQGGAQANASATGIAADGEGRDINFDSHIEVATSGVDIGATLAETTVAGDDTITNSSAVTTTAAAATPSIGVAVSSKGMSAALAASTADAKAIGIDAGAGDDEINNSGAVTTTAASLAASIGVAVTQQGGAVAGNSIWDGGTTATAEAIGISGDGDGRDHLASGSILVGEGDVHLAAGLSDRQVAGDDSIDNSSAVTTTAAAVSVSGSASAVTSTGVAAAVSTSTAESRAAGIDAGAGSDAIINRDGGVITTTAVAVAGAASVALAKSGAAVSTDAIWSGGTSAKAEAVGISGDGEGRDREILGSIDVSDDGVALAARLADTSVAGDDSISNDGVIVSSAFVLAPSVNVSVTADGASAASSTATANALAMGIDGGAGSDNVDNNGTVVATAGSVAAAVPVSVSKTGVAGSFDALWQGGTSANAEAIGISGDGIGTDYEADFSISSNEQGVELSALVSQHTVSGDDTITSDAAVTASAVATTLSAAVAVVKDGVALAGSSSTATARSAAIDAGAGNDSIDSDGVLTSTAVAIGGAVSVSVAPNGLALAGGAVLDGGTKAVAEASGISADGRGSEQHLESTLRVDAEGAHLYAGAQQNNVSGSDTIDNSAVVTTTAVAIAPSVAVSISANGVAATATTASADAHAVAIDAGAGSDTVDNTGVLTVTAGANADAVGVAVVANGASVATDAVWDGGTKANAEAVGIAGDGKGRDNGASFAIDANDDGVTLSSELHANVVSGDDEINNSGVITTTAAAIVPSVNVAVTGSAGLALSSSTAETSSRAAAIDAGSGSDVVDNSGVLTATAVSVSVSVPVSVATAGVAIASDAIWDGGTKASAAAVGISGDGVGTDFSAEFSMQVDDSGKQITAASAAKTVSGDDQIANSGAITSTAVAEVISAAVAVAPAGGAIAATSSTADARATAIDAGSGDDSIDNSGVLTSTAVANANAVSVSVAPTGVAVSGGAIWDGGTKAIAEAVGISGDGVGTDASSEFTMRVDDSGARLQTAAALATAGGQDSINNSGTVTATAAAVAPSVGVSVTAAGLAAASMTATADAKATAIDGGNDSDAITNSGTLTSTAAANADAISVGVAVAGAALATDAVWDGGTKATAEAIGIAGDGEGRDTRISSEIVRDGSGVTLQGLASSTVVSGDDTIVNSGTITATAGAIVPSVNVAVAPTAGVAISASTATTQTRAAAIDAGSGDDSVENDATLTASSVAISVSVPVSEATAGVAIASDAIWDGGSKATAEAVGISGDGVGTDFSSSLRMELSDGEKHLRASADVTTVSGDDIINNEGVITSTAVAEVVSVGVAVAPAGVAVAGAGATADARAAGIDAGAGDDQIDNAGVITSTAVANANAVSVSVVPAGLAVAGGAVWDGGTKAHAEAVGISGDGVGSDAHLSSSMDVDSDSARLEALASLTTVAGDDSIKNSDVITATSVAIAPSVGVSVAVAGVAATAMTASADATATAIDGGAGDDLIENDSGGVLTSTAVANADSVSVSVAVAGVALASDAVWDSGTRANAEAIGISGDGKGSDYSAQLVLENSDQGASLEASVASSVVSGDDQIVNKDVITSTATAVVPSIGVSVSVAGVGATAAKADTKSRAVAIDAGGGDDTVDNAGVLTSTAVSTSVSVPVSVAVIGLAASTDSVWDGGSKADAEAVGISGDGEGTDYTAQVSMQSKEGKSHIRASADASTVSGDDTISNSETITATAVATTVSAAVAVAPIGGAITGSAATATARSAGIDAGVGDDLVDNSGKITATAVANANAISVSVAPGGVAVAGGAIWSGGATADAEAVGISGDGAGDDLHAEFGMASDANGLHIDSLASAAVASGDDTIDNSGDITAVAVGVSPSIDAAITVAGLSAAASTATANAYAAAIDSGAGNDTVTNSGKLNAVSVANANSVAVAVSSSGSIAGDAIWEGGTEANASAVGISGDGKGRNYSAEFAIDAEQSGVVLSAGLNSSVASGDDKIANSGDIYVESVAVAPSISVGAAMAGFSAAAAKAQTHSRAAAIDAGSGNDEVNNTGDLQTYARGVSVAVPIAATTTGVSVALGGTETDVEAVGISGDGEGNNFSANSVLSASAGGVEIQAQLASSAAGGDDDIINSGDMTVEAVGVATSVGASLGAMSATISSSSASVTAAGIDAGAGDDGVENSGQLDVDAHSTAVGVAVALGLGGAVAADAIWDGGTDASASAVGISGDGRGHNETLQTQLSLNEGGVTAGAEITSEVVSGQDQIANSGKIDATATSTATSVSTSLAGLVSVALAGAESSANASAIDAGGGDDSIENSAELRAEAIANAVSASVAVGSVAVAGGALFDGGTSADADAVGIHGDGRGVNGSEQLTISSDLQSNRIEYGHSSSVAAGNDTIVNSGAVTAYAEANTTGVAVAVGGLAAAASNSSASSSATAIDGGAGNDEIDNSGQLISVATSSATTVNISAGAAGSLALNAVWDGGTTATASAVGISGDGQGAQEQIERSFSITDGEVVLSEQRSSNNPTGDDRITNRGAIAVDATAHVPASVAVSASLVGTAVALSTSTAESTATAIQGGGGNDTIDNIDAALVAKSHATATSVNVSLVGAGNAGAADALWDGGTTARADAIGIDGDGGAQGSVSNSEIRFSDGDIALSYDTSAQNADGNDTISNNSLIWSVADAHSKSASAAAVVVGTTSALSRSTAQASAIAIRVGDGDNSVSNSGLLVVDADATAQSLSIELSAVGVSGVAAQVEDFAGSRAEANAVGIQGGSGADSVDNTGSMLLTADATTEQAALTAKLVGYSTLESETLAVANVAAIIGGDGDDQLANFAFVEGRAEAHAPSIGVALNIAGANSINLTSLTEASAVGVRGDAGADKVQNGGVLDMTAVAHATSNSFDVSVVDLPSGHSAATAASASAVALGIGGGEGDDELISVGVINASATADALVNKVGISGIDFDLGMTQSATTSAQASASGIEGGAGNDTIANGGEINVKASVIANVDTQNWTLAGLSSDAALLNSEAIAAGLLGGAGDDVLYNAEEGEIQLSLIGVLTANSTAAALIGGNVVDATLGATLSGYGMAGETGNDEVYNLGNLTLSSLLSESSSGFTLGGVTASVAKSGITGSNSLTGLSGGSGDDSVASLGDLTLDAHSALTIANSQLNFAGGTVGIATLSADTRAVGLAGDAGQDWLYSEGSINIQARAQLLAQNNSEQLLGVAAAGSGLRASAFATGMAGGLGDDEVNNSAETIVDARASLTSTGASFTLIGANATQALLNSVAGAVGIDGGDGSDLLRNSGGLSVSATAAGASSGNSVTAVGSVKSAAIINTTATAAGIRDQDGNAKVLNSGDIGVIAAVQQSAAISASAGGLLVDGNARAGGNSVVNAAGIALGHGDNVVLNTGGIEVRAQGSGQIQTSASGLDLKVVAELLEIPLSVFTEVRSDSQSALTSSFAAGVVSGLGDDAINNQGAILVSSEMVARSLSQSDGSGFLRGNGTAISGAAVNGISALGIDASGGANVISNSGRVEVTAQQIAIAQANSSSRGLDLLDVAVSSANASASASDALAIGLNVGDGDNGIWNSGELIVKANPRAIGNASAQAPNVIGNLAVDSVAFAAARADNAQAFGIRLGNGANSVYNEGEISVLANPVANAIGYAQGLGFDGDAFVLGNAYARNALAVGIDAGEGGNRIINDGTINAIAQPVATRSFTTVAGGGEIEAAIENSEICSGSLSSVPILGWIVQAGCTVAGAVGDVIVDDGETYIEPAAPDAIAGASAYGIRSGSGNDVIVNNGWIRAQAFGDSSAQSFAIHTGAGNDQVFLTGGSTTMGNVELGEGNDELFIVDTPAAMVGSLSGGIGADTLGVDGNATLNGSVSGFETLTLYGNSHFDAIAINGVSQLGVNNGQLKVGVGYTLTGNFDVRINADGSGGQLSSVGVINLGGSLNVAKSGGAYQNGSQWTLVSGGFLNNSFTSVALPNSGLINFSHGKVGNDYLITAHVTSFSEVAGSADSAVAGYLDSLVGDATGDLSLLIGQMQELPMDELDELFTSLDPGRYDTFVATDMAMREHLNATRSRLRNIRASAAGNNAPVFMSETPSLYLNPYTMKADFRELGSQNIAPRAFKTDAWMVGFMRDGGEQGGDPSRMPGYNGYGISMGVDYAFSDRFLVGVSHGTESGQGGFERIDGASAMGTSTTSLYANYLSADYRYLDAMISFTSSRFGDFRQIALGANPINAVAEHQSKMFSLVAESGMDLSTGPAHTQLFGSVSYSDFAVNGFREEGAGALNLEVDERTLRTLDAAVGLRSAMSLDVGNGTLTPQLSASVLRRFELSGSDLRVRFEGAERWFTSSSNDGEFGMQVGAGLRYEHDNGWTVQSQFNTSFGVTQQGMGGYLSVERRF